MYLLFAILLFVQFSIFSQENNSNASNANYFKPIEREIIYKKSYSSELDEYTEGAYYVYDVKDNRSQLLFADIFIDYSKAWITIDNQYIVLTINSIFFNG